MYPVSNFGGDLSRWTLDDVPALRVEKRLELPQESVVEEAHEPVAVDPRELLYWSGVLSDFNEIVGDRNNYAFNWRNFLRIVEEALKPGANLEGLISDLELRINIDPFVDLYYLVPFLEAVQAELYEYTDPERAHGFIKSTLLDLGRLKPCQKGLKSDNKVTCLAARLAVRD